MRFVGLAISAAVVLGCSDSTQPLAPRASVDAGAADDDAATDPEPDAGDPCAAPPTQARVDAPIPGCAALSDFEQLRFSPRPDALAERLAIALYEPPSGWVTEDQYGTVFRDVCAARRMTDGIEAFERGFEGITLVELEVDEPTYRQIETDTYEPWRCLNAQIGVRNIVTRVSGSRFRVIVRLAGRVAYEVAEALYARLPGVSDARTGEFFVVFNPRNSCASSFNGARTYTLISGFGDCESGCISGRILNFGATDEGVVIRRDEEGPWPDIREEGCN